MPIDENIKPMTIDEAMRTTTPEAGTDIYSNEFLNIQEKQRLIETRAAASVGEQITAFGQSMAENNMLVEWIKRSTSATYEPDPEFQKINTAERAVSIVSENMLPPSDFTELLKAKNPWEEGKILQDLLAKQQRHKFINETISEGWQTGANATGMIIDIDTAIIGPLTGLTAKGAKIGTIAKRTASIEGIGALGKSYVNDDYELAKDGILDIMLGALADTTVAKYFSKDVKGYSDLARQQGTMDAEAAKKAAADAAAQAEADMLARAQARAQAQKEATARANAMVKNENELKAAKAKQVELEQIAKAQKTKEAEQAMVANSNRLVELEKQQEILAKQQLDSELLATSQRRAQAQREATDKANQMVKLENELKANRAKQLELEQIAKAQKTKKAEKAMVDNSNRLLKLEKQLDEAKQAEMDARLRTRLEAKAEKQLARQQEVIDSINDISKNLEPRIEEILNRVKRINNDWDDASRKQGIKDLEDVVNELYRRYPKEAKDLKSFFEHTKRPNYKDNSLVASSKLTGKQKALIIGAATASTAFAADGSESDGLPLAQIMIAAIAVGVLGPQVLKGFKNGGMKGVVGHLASKFKQESDITAYKNSPEGKKTMNYIAGLTNTFNSGLNSTYQEIKKYGNEKATAIADKLLFNPLNGAIETADAEKQFMIWGEQAKVSGALKRGFRQYIDSLGIAKYSFFQLDEARVKFNKLVSRAIEGEDITEPGIKEAAGEISQVFKQALDYAKEVGVYGATDIVSMKNYLPRLYKFNALHEALRGTDDAGRALIKKQFANMIKGPKAYEQADELVGWFMDTKNFTGKKADEILAKLDEFLSPGYDKTKAKEKLQTTGEKYARLKARIDMDMMKFEPIEIKVNGIDTRITLDSIVERDIQNVTDKYLNQMYGQIALARRGYTSVQQLRNAIGEIGNANAEESLNTIVDLILGNPLTINNRRMHEFTTAIKGLTFVAALPLVAFSMVPEMMKAVSNAGLSMTLKNFSNLFKSMNKDSELFRTITELSGLGTHSIRDRVDVKGIDNSEIGEIGVESWAARTSVKGQEMLARMSGLVKFSDVFQRLTLLKSTTDFANFVAGKAHSIPLSRLDSYGLDDSLKELFKGDFKFDKKGELLAVNTEGWSYAKRAKFNNIMTRLNQEITPEVILGTTGRWTKDNDLGKILSFLVSYPMNLYANQAVKDAHYLDWRAAGNTVMTFAGTYLGLAAKYEAEGREYTHEDLVKYSIMNLPSMALIGVLRGAADPAIVSKMTTIKDDVDVLANGLYEDVIK